MDAKMSGLPSKCSTTLDETYTVTSMSEHVDCSGNNVPLSVTSIDNRAVSVLGDKQRVIIMTEPNASSVIEPQPNELDDNGKMSCDPESSTGHQHNFGEPDSVDSNYFVLVESSDGAQVIPGVIPNILQSTGEESQMSLNTVLHSDISYVNGNALSQGNKQSNYSTEAVTMVIDSTLQHDEAQKVFVEPSSFISINGQNISPVQLAIIEKNSKMTLNEGLSGKNVIIHPDSSLCQNVQSDESSSQMENQPADSQMKLIPASTYDWDSKVKDAPEDSISSTLNEDLISIEMKEVEKQFKEEQRQVNLRLLEQSHLEHQEKLLQRRNMKEDEKNEDLFGDQTEEMLKGVGINDDTPIFSHISAQINPDILLHVPGCQTFLLNEATLKCDSSKVTFSSELNCCFVGDMKNLVSMHTVIKSLLRLCSPTNLMFDKGKDRGKKKDKNVSCNLLMPYISSKGRISKQSSKLMQMENLSKLDESPSDGDVSDGKDDLKRQQRVPRKKRFISKKRYKNPPPKCLSHDMSLDDFKPHCDLDEVPSDISQWDSSQSLPKQSEMQVSNTQDVRSEVPSGDSVMCENVDEACSHNSSLHNSMDPVQKRLLEEQIKCKQIYEENNKLRQLKAVMVAHRKEEAKQSFDKPASDGLVETVNAHHSSHISPRRNRGRPPKKFDPSEIIGRVKPRNPLTESAETKQRRIYEENVAFKFFCDQCSFKTKRQSQFDNHLTYHEKGKGVKHFCPHCDFVSISLPALKQHELQHKRNVLRCDICSIYVTDKKYLLQKHMRLKHSSRAVTVVKDKKFSCHQCSDTFSNRISLGRHEAMHLKSLVGPTTENTSENICPQCKKSFGKKIHLHRHIKDVHGPQLRPHLCDKCGQSFKRKDALQQHRIVHVAKSSRNLPFKCGKCDKAFRSQAHLKEHSSIHSTDRPFLCQYCGASFKTQPVQKKHILTLHVQPRTHVCTVCYRQFNSKIALQRHEHTHKMTNEQSETCEQIKAWDSQVLDTEMKKMDAKNDGTVDHVSSNVIVSLEEDPTPAALMVKTEIGAQVMVDPNLVPVMMGPIDGDASTNARNLQVQEPLIPDGQTDQTYYYLADDNLQIIQ